MASKTYEESIESIDERIAQLRARRRDEVARVLGQLGPHRARFRVQGGPPSTEEAIRAYRAFRRDVAEADPADESEEE